MLVTPDKNCVDTGVEVTDLRDNPQFAARNLHVRDIATQIEGLRLLSHAFISTPFSIYQALVNAAVDLCGADSAGISIERDEHERTDDNFYHWVAVAGQYSNFTNAILPREPSACTICLERGGPQHFRVTSRFFELMGIEAAPVTDGILLPWEVDDMRGTIWILAHGRDEAFDRNDVRMMEFLADFAAMGTQHQRRQLRLMQTAGSAAAADMASGLAHQINNPLQAITNLVFLASEGGSGASARILASEIAPHLELLTSLVTLILSLPPTQQVH